jgi:hypothetical protein
MEAIFAPEASASPDGKTVIFAARFQGRPVKCSVTRSALEQHFWAPIGGDERRLLKAFSDGHSRIAAVAERKMLKVPGTPIKLTDTDFRY